MMPPKTHASRIPVSTRPYHSPLRIARRLAERVSSHVCLEGQRMTGMDIGWMMDCDYRAGQTQREAFDAVLTTADLAETLGFDGIWLAERHFSPPGAPCWSPPSAQPRS
jgi:hypothetical protein